MKKVLSFYLKIFAIACLVLITLCSFSLFIMYDNSDDNHPDDVTSYFYYLPEDTVDVLFLGDSHSFCTFNSQDIFNKAGISSASLATSSNSILNSYWELKHALKNQKPKLVVLETHTMEVALDETAGGMYLHIVSGISNLPDLSIDKLLNYIDIKANKDGIYDEISLSDIYSFMKYKEGYNKINDYSLKDLVNYLKNPAKQYRTFGFYPNSPVNPIGQLTTYQNNYEYVDFKTTLEYKYLTKIYDLCTENNIDLLLCRAIWQDDTDLHFFNEQIDDWAKSKEVNVIDYFKVNDECQFDLNTDYRDIGHYNYLGAKKATAYFIDYISNNYDFVDHRGDSKYELWENNDFDYNLIEEETINNIGK